VNISKNLSECIFPVDSNIRHWNKLDINNDGLTDLLVIGFIQSANANNVFRSYLIMDKGVGGFRIIPIVYLTLSFSNLSTCEYVTLLKRSMDFIVFHRNELILKPTRWVDRSRHTDTLTYKFGELIEYNHTPEHLNINSISFSTGGCLGECPIYSIDIDAKGGLLYDAYEYNEVKGKFKSKITKTHLAEIINVLNYIKIKKLQNKYRVPWTDDQTGTLTINFSNGESKELSDYGMMGSFGLQKLYSLLFDLRTNQKWQKLKE
jgi:hypothetical protein